MNWKDFKKEKPTIKNEYYLIAKSWGNDLLYEVVFWDGKHFTFWDYYNDCKSVATNVEYWCEIVNPKLANKNKLNKKYDIWVEGYACTGESGTAQLIHKDIEGFDFIDACINWAKLYPGEAKSWGGLDISSNGNPNCWGCRLFPTEEEARESFG